MAQIVSNAKNWIEMDGETVLEKRLNSLITVNMIGHIEIPSDECLSHALAIIEIKALPNGSVEEYLEEQFSMRPSQYLLDSIDKIFAKWNKTKQTSQSYQ